MTNANNLPFNPWTATAKEAENEDAMRLPTKLELSQELNRLPSGSPAWQEARYRLEPFLFSAVCQRAIAIKLKKQLENLQSLSGIELVELAIAVLEFGLPAPIDFSGRFHEITRPVVNGKLKDWNAVLGKLAKGRTERLRFSHGINYEVYCAVERLLREKPGKYIKKCGESVNANKKSVFEAVAESNDIRDFDGTPLTLSEKAIEKIYHSIRILRDSED